MNTKPSILYVEDDKDNRDMIEFYFTHKGYKIVTAANMAEGFQKAQENIFDLFMLDSRLPDGNGTDLALKLRQIYPSTPVIHYTGFVKDRHQTMAKCGEAYLEKPTTFEEIEWTITNLLIAKQIVEQV
jgi:DNA-binding response OmpR family regulator